MSEVVTFLGEVLLSREAFLVGSCIFMAAIVFIPKLRKMFF